MTDLELARECGASSVPLWGPPTATFTKSQLAAFADRIRQDEREQCAKVCEISAQSILLMAGELSSAELRAVRAVLHNRAFAIRSRK